MPDVYTEPWYEAVRQAINDGASCLRSLPPGRFVVAVSIDPDGGSPYVGDGGRRFLMEIDEGLCCWYRELGPDDDEKAVAGRVDYRFRGPATVFDEIAAGQVDPIDAALRGTIAVRGDMRRLLREAEHVKVLLDAYARSVDTTWPLGRPPYGRPLDAREAAAGA